MANPIGATIPHSITGATDSGINQHMILNTRKDNKQLRFNSREFNQVSGNSIAFQAKPDQRTTTSGEVIGGEISPRVQNGIGAGVLKGLHIDTDIKGTGGGNIASVRVLELEAVDAGANSRTISGDIAFIRVRSNMSPGTLSGDQAVVLVEAKEGSKDFSAFAKFAAASAIAANHTSTGASLPSNVGWVRAKVGATYYKIPLYND